MSRSKAEVLLDIYSEAEYIVFTEPVTVIRIGDSCDAARGLLLRNRASTGVIITAWNPFSEERSAEENSEKNAEMLAEIERAGLRHIAAEGRDPNGVWHAEASFLVLDPPRELIAAWLEKFEQNAVVFVERDAPATLILHSRYRA